MSGWQPFRLVPDDVLFFRDGKPSSLGDDHYLRSLFPPLPSTLYGAVRTRRLLDEKIELDGLRNAAAWSSRLGSRSLIAELGEWGGFGSLQLRGPWLLQGDVVLLPAPFDLAVVEKKTKEKEPPAIDQVLRYRADAAPSGKWSHSLALPILDEWSGMEAPSAPARWLLTPQGIERWCRGELPQTKDFVHQSELWTDEPRTGVGLEKHQRTSDAGKLYTFGFIRLKENVSLGFEVRGTGKLKAGGALRLGGEGRMARLEDGPRLPLPAPPDSRDGRFRFGFFTPALSAAGAWPPGFVAGNRDGRLADRPCTLRAAICRGAVAVGGWDIANERAKPLRRAIPAGSVYLCEGSKPDVAAVIHGASLNDFGGEHLSRQGFGLVLAARDDQEEV